MEERNKSLKYFSGQFTVEFIFKLQGKMSMLIIIFQCGTLSSLVHTGPSLICQSIDSQLSLSVFWFPITHFQPLQ